MRMRFVAAVIAFSALGIVAASADPVVYDPALPRDSESLSALNLKQLIVVQEAAQACRGVGRSIACIMMQVDSVVSQSNDPALKAFNAALPMQARYNQDRPASYWQLMVKETAAPMTP